MGGLGRKSDEARKWGLLAWEDVGLGSRSLSQGLSPGIRPLLLLSMSLNVFSCLFGMGGCIEPHHRSLLRQGETYFYLLFLFFFFFLVLRIESRASCT